MNQDKIKQLLRIDSERLYQRILERKNEYIATFSVKRTREPFKDIFFSRYKTVDIASLSMLDENMIDALDHFYSAVEEMEWYLNHTEDMPASVEDKVGHFISKISKYFTGLSSCFDFNYHSGINNHDEDEAPPIPEA